MTPIPEVLPTRLVRHYVFWDYKKSGGYEVQAPLSAYLPLAEISQDVGRTLLRFNSSFSNVTEPQTECTPRHTPKSFYSWTPRAEEAFYLAITYVLSSAHHTPLCRVARASIYGISLHLQHKAASLWNKAVEECTRENIVSHAFSGEHGQIGRFLAIEKFGLAKEDIGIRQVIQISRVS